MMPSFALISVLVTAGAMFSFLSYRVLRLPTTIGTMLLSLFAALILLIFGHTVPTIHAIAYRLISSIDLNEVVLHGMLAFLLFAGALQLDLKQLKRERVAVLSLSVFATALSTVIVGFLFMEGLKLVGTPITLTHALLFGALISPTDPIAVLEMLQRVGAPPELKVQLAGESLFNDGVGAVIFVALLGASASSAHGTLPSPLTFGSLLLVEAGGGIALGLILGYFVHRLICTVDSYRVEVMLTLALAMGGYALADKLHLSAPLEAVSAGLMVSGTARRTAMSATTRDHLEKFWELTNDIMDVVLFLLLGLQLLIVPLSFSLLAAGLIAIPIVLLARYASVTTVVQGLATFRHKVTAGNVAILTWGGLRGALAVALALALPEDGTGARNLLLAATYITVIFSVLVQGLTMSPLLRRMQPRLAAADG